MAAELPDIRLDGRVAIMTGGDRGLGLEMATCLARAGARLALASPDAARLAEAVASVKAAGGAGSAIAVPTDITDLDGCRALVSRTVAQFGRLDVLFNNARRLHRAPGLPPAGNSLPFFESDPMVWRETVMVNVVGTFFMARAAVEHFRKAGAGKIVNLSTSLRNMYEARNSPYGVTKAAVEAETLIWARDLEGSGITVNTLLPGGACDSDPARPKSPRQTLLPIDIMNPLALWLASSRSDGVTGCRFVGRLWDPALPPDEAAMTAREEPTFSTQPRTSTILHRH